jgi:hypothetical protein
VSVRALRDGVADVAVAGEAFFFDDGDTVEVIAEHACREEARDASPKDNGVAFSGRTHAGGWIRFGITIVTCMGLGIRCCR